MKRRTLNGTLIQSAWSANLFGGTFELSTGGYCWTPGLLRRTKKYFREGWYKEGRPYFKFIWVKK